MDIELKRRVPSGSAKVSTLELTCLDLQVGFVFFFFSCRSQSAVLEQEPEPDVSKVHMVERYF